MILHGLQNFVRLKTDRIMVSIGNVSVEQAMKEQLVARTNVQDVKSKFVESNNIHALMLKC